MYLFNIFPGRQPALLADAEAAEDPAKQVITADFTGDLAEFLLRQPQFLCQQFTGLQFIQLPLSGKQVLLHPLQGIEVAATGAEITCCLFTIADAVLQVCTQVIHAGTGLHGEGVTR